MLSPAKSRLLVRLLQKEGVAAAVEALPVRPAGDLPLSINQEGRFFLEWLKKLPQLNNLVSFSLKEESDPALLEQALNEIVCRHDVLRTGFVSAQNLSSAAGDVVLPPVGQPLFRQRVYETATLKLQMETLSIGASDEAAQISRIAKKLLDVPFSYSSGPLLRATLLKLKSGSYQVLIAVSHLLFDRQSWTLFSRELAALYSARLRGETVSLPDCGQYPDFARWQRHAVQTGVFDWGLDYWIQQWMKCEDALIARGDLPFPRPGPQEMQLRVRPEALVIDSALFKRAKAFAHCHELTVYMLFLVAFSLLLHKYTGKRRLAIWGHTANRIRPGTEFMLGWLANSHALLSDTRSDPDVRSYVAQVRAVVLEGIRHQEVPLLLVAAAFQKKHRKMMRLYTDLFISLDCVVSAGWRLSDGLLEFAEPPVTSNTGLEVMVYDCGENAKIVASYSGSHFASTTVCRILLDIKKALEWMILNENSTVSQFRTAD